MQTNIHDEAKKLHRTATRCYAEIGEIFTSIFMTHTFINGSEANLEGVMTIPIPKNSNVKAVSAKLNDGTVKKSEVLPKEDAARQYEENIEKGQSPILVKHTAAGYITLNIGTLEPNDKVEIEIELAHKLTIVNDKIKFIVPTAITPKYGDPLAAGYEPQELPTVNLISEQEFKIHVHMKDKFANAAVEADFQNLVPVEDQKIKKYLNDEHDYSVIVSFENAKQMLATKEKVFSNRDFVLSIELPKSYNEKVLQTVDPVTNGVIACASIYDQVNEKISVNPKVHVLVDCSASMGGWSEELSRSCVENLAFQLPDKAKTALSLFGSNLKNIYPLNESYSGERLAINCNQIGSHMGGTELENSLLSVLRMEENSNADVLLITDGAVYGNNDLLYQLKEHSNRVFTVAIGTSSSQQFLDDIADLTDGISVICHKNEDISAAMKTIIDSICRSKTKVTEILWPGKPEWSSLLPKVIFDNISATVYAFYNEPIFVNEKLLIEIETEDGTVDKALLFDKVSDTNNALVAHAAADRIFSIANDKKEKTKLAIDYQILTSNTSMFIPNLRNEDDVVHSEGTQSIDGMMTDSHGFGSYSSTQHTTNLAKNICAILPPSFKDENLVLNYCIAPDFDMQKRRPANNSHKPYEFKIPNIRGYYPRTFDRRDYEKAVCFNSTIEWLAQLFNSDEKGILKSLSLIEEGYTSKKLDSKMIEDLTYRLSRYEIKNTKFHNYITGLWEVLEILLQYSRTTPNELNVFALPYKNMKIARTPFNFLFTYIEYYYGNSSENPADYLPSVLRDILDNSKNKINSEPLVTYVANSLIKKFSLNQNYIYKHDGGNNIFDLLFQKTTLTKWNISKKSINDFNRAYKKNMSNF